ncbi:UNVERIFIED_CONTAM: hypothetical protein NCL1_13586 [Trichonephila clavipes]
MCMLKPTVKRWTLSDGVQETKDLPRPNQRHNVHLLRYIDDGDDFLQHIVAGDETWGNYFQTEGKSVSTQWKKSDSSGPKKFEVQQSARKVIVTAFFDIQGPLLLKCAPTSMPKDTPKHLINCIRLSN